MQTQEQRNECEYWRVETLRRVKIELDHAKMIDLGLGDLARAGIVDFKFHNVEDNNASYVQWLSGNGNFNLLTDVLIAFDYMGAKRRTALDTQNMVRNWSKFDHEGLMRKLSMATAGVPIEIDDLDEAVELLGVGGGSW